MSDRRQPGSPTVVRPASCRRQRGKRATLPVRERGGAVSMKSAIGLAVLVSAAALTAEAFAGPGAGVITTVAGNGHVGAYATQDVAPVAATAWPVSRPVGLAFDGPGNLYIADFSD